MRKKIEYKYIVSFIYILILFLDRLDLTITNVAMPTFAKDFQIPVTQTDWIATSFLIALGVVMPASGWLADNFGTKKIFIASNILFTLGSVLCAFAWSFYSLIFFRILQGMGGGVLIPVGMSMAYRAFSTKDYPKLANYTLIPTLIAPSIAPLLGGIILQYLNWHWIFILHLPIGTTAIILSFLFLKEDDKINFTHQIQSNKFDWPGFITLALSLSSLFYLLSRIGLVGLNNSGVKISGISAVLFFSFFIFSELKTNNPLINLNFFRKELFLQANILQLTLQICYFGSIFLIALYFQTCIGMTPLQSGLSMTGQSIGTICMLFFSQKIFNRFGPKYSIMTGFCFIAITTYLILMIHNPGQILLANIILFSRGLAIGLTNGPLQACAMFDLEKNETSKGSAIFNVLRQVGISLGVGLSCMILAIQLRNAPLLAIAHNNQDNVLAAFKVTFLIFSIIAVFAAIYSVKINNKRILFKLRES